MFFFLLCCFASAATQLIKELENRLPQFALLDGMGILYALYWLQPNCGESFVKHLDILKTKYCELKVMGFGEYNKLVLALLNYCQLDFGQGMFKLCMKSNFKVVMETPFVFNPLTWIYRIVDAS